MLCQVGCLMSQHEARYHSHGVNFVAFLIVLPGTLVWCQGLLTFLLTFEGTCHIPQATFPPIQQTVQSILTTAHCTLQNTLYTLQNAHCTLQTVHCTLQTAHCTLQTAHCILHNEYCTCLFSTIIVPTASRQVCSLAFLKFKQHIAPNCYTLHCS